MKVPEAVRLASALRMQRAATILHYTTTYGAAHGSTASSHLQRRIQLRKQNIRRKKNLPRWPKHATHSKRCSKSQNVGYRRVKVSSNTGLVANWQYWSSGVPYPILLCIHFTNVSRYVPLCPLTSKSKWRPQHSDREQANSKARLHHSRLKKYKKNINPWDGLSVRHRPVGAQAT
jgi:hypothetical protein